MTAFTNVALCCDTPGCDQEWVGVPGEGVSLVRGQARLRGWRDRPDDTRRGELPARRRDACPTCAAGAADRHRSGARQ
ncbi:MAG: hypothetical protein ACR2G2_09225 [Pseudonocardia sp.]